MFFFVVGGDQQVVEVDEHSLEAIQDGGDEALEGLCRVLETHTESQEAVHTPGAGDGRLGGAVRRQFDLVVGAEKV